MADKVLLPKDVKRWIDLLVASAVGDPKAKLVLIVGKGSRVATIGVVDEKMIKDPEAIGLLVASLVAKP
jgi:hypothetical protein